MARGALSENERHSFEAAAKTHPEHVSEKSEEKSLNCDGKPNGLRVRFMDEEGKTERFLSTDELDRAVSRVKKIHILKNRSSSETSILLRNPSLAKRRSSAAELRSKGDGHGDGFNNNSLSENFNGNGITPVESNGKAHDGKTTETEKNEDTKDTDTNGQFFRKNAFVYSVNQAKTLTCERKRSTHLSSIPKLIGHRASDSDSSGRSILPSEADYLVDSVDSKDFTARALGRLSRGLGRLLRRTNSVRISEPDPVFKVAYLGNVLTGWARGDSCVEKPLATLWRNYQQSTKPDVVMKLSVTNSGLKGFTKEHGLTEYWSHRITYCASPLHYPKLFCWVYRHEGKKLKHELRCHAVLCSKESISKKITEDLQIKLRQALIEFKKDRISKQNARLSLANSVYDNPSMPRRKILLSVGATNYRPPLERSKSAPKLGAIEEMCSEEDEEEAEMNAKQTFCKSWTRNSLDKAAIDEFTFGRWRSENRSPRKYSCPEPIVARNSSDSNTANAVISDELINILVEESNKKANEFLKLDDENKETSHKECNGICADTVRCRFHTLECIEESNEVFDSNTTCSAAKQKNVQLLSQSNFLVSDSDDGSVSSGCETASTATSSDAEPTSLPSQFLQEELFNGKHTKERRIPAFERIQSYDQTAVPEESRSLTATNHASSDNGLNDIHVYGEVNAVPIGEKNVFRRRSTYPPFKTDGSLISNFESLLDTLTDIESLNSSTDTGVFKSAGDNDSACSDESGYSEPLDSGKDSVIGSTIMV